MTGRRGVTTAIWREPASRWQHPASGSWERRATLAAVARRVAIAGNTPTWRRGVSAVLTDAGYEAIECESIAEWKPGRHGVAVVLGIRNNSVLADVETFADEHPHIPVVAVLQSLDLSDVAAALRAGAAAAVGDDESTESYHTVVESAVAGRTALPIELVQAMAVRIPEAPQADAWVTPSEADWLRRLAAGTTVATLASDVGYSEREMFRLLHGLYVRIGVKNRTEAIIWATRHGVLDDTNAG